MEYDVALFFAELVEGHIGTNTHFTTDVFHQAPHKVSPYHHSTFIDSKRLVGHQRGFIYRTHNTCTLAFGTGAFTVKCHGFSARSIKAHAAGRAHYFLFERYCHSGRAGMTVRALVATQARKQQAQVVE